MSEIIVIASLHAKPGRGADLLALLSELIPPVLRSEPNLQRYAFYVEPGSDPLHVTVIEKYASKADMDAHNSGVLTGYLPRLLDLVDPAPHTVELHPAPLTITAGAADARLTI
ncbi:antibiotic biosynthesis monooxygenase [Nocardia sp. NEAU-G5]|uniref:Antibiotic biosynthesis monooxygenase n=1 Tax=Nocardia albiluteola TaxID=2842303 RepID=A0ABS6BBZ0_9NOCA|nr:antibiotic biosynthesis monooxygenase [Nocardia albiluteola]MBU3067807.1 antibiotic biosynthesis monooxygenase [Nocardia albiluteola]